MKVGTDAVLIGAWAQVNNSKKILDIGTGCGVIALMLAQKALNATIDALEIDQRSCKEALQNFKNSAWQNRLNIINCDLKTFKDHTPAKYDLIVSNPPFFSAGTKSPEEKRAKARHNHSLTLEVLTTCIDELLAEHGRAALVMPPEEGEGVITQAHKIGLYCTKITYFKSKSDRPPERYLVEFARFENQLTAGELIHYTSDCNWTDDYKALTKPYYLTL